MLRAAARLSPAIARAMKQRRGELDGAARMLESLSHKSVLARGFVMIHREDGSLVRAAGDLAAGEIVELSFANEEHRRAMIDPPTERGAAAPVPEAVAQEAKPRPVVKTPGKPPGDQGSLF